MQLRIPQTASRHANRLETALLPLNKPFATIHIIGKSSRVGYVRPTGPSQLIIRVVKMHFTEAGVSEFLEIFDQNKVAIRNFPGCSHLELLKEASDETVFATLSHWENEQSLDNYRKSELFASVWGRVKTLFAKPTQAFSFQKFIEL